MQDRISHFITMKWEILSPTPHVIFTHTQNSHQIEHFSLKHKTFLRKISHGRKEALFLYIYTTHKEHFYTTHTFLHCNSQGIFLHNSQRRDMFTQWLTMKGHFYTSTHKTGTFLHQYSSQKRMFLHQYSLQRRDSFTPIQFTEKGHFYTNTAHREGTFLHQYSSQRRDSFTPIQLTEKGHFYTNAAHKKGCFYTNIAYREGTLLHQYSLQRRDIITPIQLTEKGHFYTNTARREGTFLHQYSSHGGDIFTPIQLTQRGHFYTNTAHREGTFLHQCSSQRRDIFTTQLTGNGSFQVAPTMEGRTTAMGRPAPSVRRIHSASCLV